MKYILPLIALIVATAHADDLYIRIDAHTPSEYLLTAATPETDDWTPATRLAPGEKPPPRSMTFGHAGQQYYVMPTSIPTTWADYAEALTAFDEHWLRRLTALHEFGRITEAQYLAAQAKYTNLLNAQADGLTPTAGLRLLHQTDALFRAATQLPGVYQNP